MDWFTQQDMHVFEYKHRLRAMKRRQQWMENIVASRLAFRLAMRRSSQQLTDALVDDATAILKGSVEMLILEHIHGAINAETLNPPASYNYRFARRSKETSS